LERGLKFAQQRQEELENTRFQIQVMSNNLNAEDSQTKSTLDELLMTYNNWMYPHLDIERKDFVRDSVETYKLLKDAHKNLKVKHTPIDPNEQLNLTLGK